MCRLAFLGSTLIILTLAASSAFAQDRFVVIEDIEGNSNSDAPCKLADQGSLTIDPASGNISITVEELQDCLGSALALDVSELFVTPNSVIAGTAFTIVWASVGPMDDTVAGYACTATSGEGPNPLLPGWLATSIGLSGPTSVTVPASTGSGTYDLGISCSIPDDIDSTISRSAQIQVTQQAVNRPPEPSLTVNGVSTSTSIDQGDSVTIVWSSQNASSCTALGNFPGWAGTKALSDTEILSNTSQIGVGSYTISLRCSNSGGLSPVASVGLSVNNPDDPPPAECSDRLLLGQGSLNNWVRKTTGSNSCVWNTRAGAVDQTVDCRNFGDAAGGGPVGVWDLPWPAQSSTRNLTISGNQGRQFIAMAFNSGNISATHVGRMTQEVPQFAGANAGFKLWSISKCPGDYNKALIDAEMGPGCVFRERTNLIQAFEWGGPSFESDELRCALQPNTDYYFNIIWSADQPGTPPEQIVPFQACQTARCGMNATPGGTYVP